MFSQDFHIPNECFAHQCQRKEKIIDISLVGFNFWLFSFMFQNSNFSKETQNRFWIHKFPRETPWEVPQPMFAIYSYSYYRLISYLLGDNWLICRLHAQCMIFNVRLCFVGGSLQNIVWRVSVQVYFIVLPLLVYPYLELDIFIYLFITTLFVIINTKRLPSGRNWILM